MGAFDVEHLDAELESRAEARSVDLDLEEKLVTSAIEDAVRVWLQGLGEDATREGLLKTPLRVAKALREGTRGYRQNVNDIVEGALFPEAGLDNRAGQAGGAGGLVVVRNLDLFSHCESCLLPFKVQCQVGYIPSAQRVVGLSKLSRVADVFAKRLQDPQRLANEICSALHNSIKPAGVAISLVCWHIRYPTFEEENPVPTHLTNESMRGWTPVSVFSGSGVFESEKSDAWNDYLALLKFRGMTLERKNSLNPCWCPAKAINLPFSNGHCKKKASNGRSSSTAETTKYTEMVNSVALVLHCLGEDPLRHELVDTPHRFVQWLMNFKSSTIDARLGSLQQPAALRSLRRDLSCNPSKTRSELNLPFWAQCEHHLLPFHGVVHICYICSGDSEPLERSILQSIVHFHGFKLQVQERVTRQIAETTSSLFHLSDVMVVVEASHICMISRGIEKVGSSTATMAVMGQFSTDSKAKADFLGAVSSSTASSQQ